MSRGNLIWLTASVTILTGGSSFLLFGPWLGLSEVFILLVPVALFFLASGEQVVAESFGDTAWLNRISQADIAFAVGMFLPIVFLVIGLPFIAVLCLWISVFASAVLYGMSAFAMSTTASSRGLWLPILMAILQIVFIFNVANLGLCLGTALICRGCWALMQIGYLKAAL